RRLPAHVQFDDLYSAGLVALVEAARRFDGGRGISFDDYARHRVHGAMLDELRRDDTVSRRRRRRIRLGNDHDGLPPPRLVELGAAASVPDESADPEGALEQRRSMRRLEEAERRLPDRLRLVVRLRL